jgi:hypothetical protein
MYTATFTDVAVTAAQDLFQIEAVTNPLTIHKIVISQNSDYGDAQAEGLTILLRGEITDAVTDDVTAVPLNATADGVANLSNVAVNETSQLTTGATTFWAEVWNIQVPWIWAPTPDERYHADIGDCVVVDLSAAPADSLTMSGVLVFEEW